jgi:hypothetical protein
MLILLGLLIGQDLDGQMETTVQLVLPLLGETAWADYKASLEVTARDQLLDEQPGHDRLARARVVGQKDLSG